MNRVLQTSTLLVALLGFSTISNAAQSSEQLLSDPRCTPYPECIPSLTKTQPQTSSDILNQMTLTMKWPSEKL